MDALASGLVEGKVLLPLTTGADHLMAYWRGRAERFGAKERRAIYEQVFSLSDTSPEGVVGCFSRLCLYLAQIGTAASTESLAPMRAGAAVVAQELAFLLSSRAVGMAAFAAREIMTQIREAMGVLEDRDISVVLGGGNLWQMLNAHAPQILGHPVRAEAALTRARSGMLILKWVAEVAGSLGSGTVALDRSSPVVQAALAWQATGAS